MPDAEGRVREYGDRKQALIWEYIENGDFYAYPDALRFVLAVKGVGLKMAMASSRNANAFLERIRLGEVCEKEGLSYGFVRDGYTILDILDANVSGRDFERGKPHPEIFLTAAEEMGTPPARTFVLEDAANGIQAAKAGGMAAIGLARADDEELLAEAKADLVVTSLGQVSVGALSEGRLRRADAR